VAAVIRRVVAASLAATLTASALTGCDAQPSSSGASGTVVERERHKASSKSWRKYNYTLTVHEDGGKRDEGRVSRQTYEQCQVGDRWPDCKK